MSIFRVAVLLNELNLKVISAINRSTNSIARGLRYYSSGFSAGPFCDTVTLQRSLELLALNEAFLPIFLSACKFYEILHQWFVSYVACPGYNPHLRCRL